MRTYVKYGEKLEKINQWEANSWISIEDPSKEDKNFLIEELKVPEAFYNDIEDMDERPRMEEENGWTLIIIRVPFKSNNFDRPYETGPLGIIFKDDVFVTISFFRTELIADFINYSNRKHISVHNHIVLVLRLLLTSSIWFLKYLKQINKKIKSAENTLEKSIKNEDLQTLFKIEKTLVYFTTSLRGNNILIHRILNYKSYKPIIEDQSELVEDVEIELRQALETTNIYSDILTGMMDAYASVISNNLNVIMKQLTSISIILMIPTLIASLYGMNVPNELQHNKFGFLIVVSVTIVITLAGVLFFRRRRWF